MRIFDGKTYRDMTQEELKTYNQHTREQQIVEIEQWFEMYDNQVKQYNRCTRLNIPYDNKYGTIEELDKLAIEKAARLNELKK